MKLGKKGVAKGHKSNIGSEQETLQTAFNA